MDMRTHLVVVAALFTLTSACADSRLVAPSGPAQTYPAPPFPALARPGTAYRAPDALYSRNRPAEMPQASRYVLHDDGTFALQFSAVEGFVALPGRWTRAGSQITLDFDSWGAGAAAATLVGDELTVTYGTMMSNSDFLDGLYVKSPGSP
jgi:hypothetical protein